MITGMPVASGGMAFLLNIVTCGIYGFYWAYKMGEKVDMMKVQKGLPSQNSSIIYLLLNLLGYGIIVSCLAQNEVNNFANTANS